MPRNWAFAHGIIRQESSFERTAVSSAGARGLMQLMPGTARQTAGRVGVSYDLGRLTADPAYNVLLGNYYLSQLMDEWGGNAVLVAAAYNAGSGNVRRWIAANGDPASPGADMVRWIEEIPFRDPQLRAAGARECRGLRHDQSQWRRLQARSRSSIISASASPAEPDVMSDRPNYITPAGYRRLRENMRPCSPASGRNCSKSSPGRRPMATDRENADYQYGRRRLARSTGGSTLRNGWAGQGHRPSRQETGQAWFGATSPWRTKGPGRVVTLVAPGETDVENAGSASIPRSRGRFGAAVTCAYTAAGTMEVDRSSGSLPLLLLPFAR
jgi:hypothetical protein